MARKSANGNQGADRESEGTGSNNTPIIDGDVISASESDSTNESTDNGVVNPSDIITSEPDPGEGGDTPRRRGRPKGSRNSTGTKARKETTQDLSGALFSIHFLLSKMVDVEELELDESEAKKLSDSIVRLNELYGGVVIPEKVLAWISLATTCGGIYGPRMAAYGLRKRKEAKEEKANVIPGVLV